MPWAAALLTDFLGFLSESPILLLALLAFFAGFVDAIAGGGGLIQVPALLILVPEAAPATLLGTNKFASVWGTGMAAYQYLRRVRLDWIPVLSTTGSALLMGFMGASWVAHLNIELLRPVVLVLLSLMLAYTLWNQQLGIKHAPQGSTARRIALGLVIGAVLGFYDGFLGPGTGSLLILAFVSLFGFGFLAASASAKLVNVATNLAALSYFIPQGHVRWDLALPMALLNVLGGAYGARLALLRGNTLIRHCFIAVMALLLLRLSWDWLRPG